MVPLGTPCPDFDLPGIDGINHSLISFEDSEILVVIVMCNHCPYVQPQWERFVSLQKDYEKSGVQVVGINSNDAENYPEDSFEKMKEYAEEFDTNFPYLYDETQTVARALNAQCTPDLFVYDTDRTLVYRGRMDDSWDGAEDVTSTDLRDALDALIEGEDVLDEQEPSEGCSIKWKK